MTTVYHARYFAHELTRQHGPDGVDRLSMALFDACVDLNPPSPQPGLLAPAPNPRRLAHVTTMQTGIRLPVPVQLCSPRFPVGFRVPAFAPRCGD